MSEKAAEASLALLDARSSHFGLESGRHGELSAEVSRNRGRGKSASPRSEVIGSDPESRRFGRLRKEFPCPEKRCGTAEGGEWRHAAQVSRGAPEEAARF